MWKRTDPSRGGADELSSTNRKLEDEIRGEVDRDANLLKAFPKLQERAEAWRRRGRKRVREGAKFSPGAPAASTPWRRCEIELDLSCTGGACAAFVQRHAPRGCWTSEPLGDRRVRGDQRCEGSEVEGAISWGSSSRSRSSSKLRAVRSQAALVGGADRRAHQEFGGELGKARRTASRWSRDWAAEGSHWPCRGPSPAGLPDSGCCDFAAA